SGVIVVRENACSRLLLKQLILVQRVGVRFRHRWPYHRDAHGCLTGHVGQAVGSLLGRAGAVVAEELAGRVELDRVDADGQRTGETVGEGARLARPQHALSVPEVVKSEE